MSKSLDESTPPVREKRRVDARDKTIETTGDYRGHEQRSPSGQLIHHVVPPGETNVRGPIVA